MLCNLYIFELKLYTKLQNPCTDPSRKETVEEGKEKINIAINSRRNILPARTT